jgi:hypothetical protein
VFDNISSIEILVPIAYRKDIIDRVLVLMSSALLPVGARKTCHIFKGFCNVNCSIKTIIDRAIYPKWKWFRLVFRKVLL